ncbi:hypothetical protein IU433_26705 [Nocardia puris]|uniref:hypothetical protein n=1 Tax=Nocardia puris TaxID=208602 RepID=UPI001894523E|nr:hypothetical protein [Nocardia puris]MBF6212983.1 hypothetical protein [Nocardia puris]MBF6367974.1 hypothetical protein [Nocardia puris]MBF6462607.1 hypothetical protein [Nocardia puris]
MDGWRRARAWCTARGRCQFVLTAAAVVLLTGVCGALVALPYSVTPDAPAAQHLVTDSAGQPTAEDPRLAAVRRTLEPFGPIETVTVPGADGRDSLVAGHPSHRADMEVLAAALPEAIASVTDLWGPDWARSALVVVAATPSEFAALVRAGAQMLTGVAAASVSDPFTPGTQPTGQRVVFSPDAGRRLSPEAMSTLLRHELTHIAARAQTVDGAPQWMLEGFAEYAAHRNGERAFADIAPTLDADLRRGALPADLPADPEFGGANAVLAYEQAWSVSEYVAQRYDEARLVALYRRLAAAPVDVAGEDAILREVLGTGRASFVAGWRDWLPARPR